MEMIGECKLCKNLADLQISHAIGNAVFKKIFRGNSGKAICLSNGENPLHYSNDSWSEHQLCEGCEKLLNEEYEQYSLNVLRGSGCDISKSSLGVTFRNVEIKLLILYFLSIYWRAANSGHPSYGYALIGRDLNERLRNDIYCGNDVSVRDVGVKISRVIDASRITETNDSNRFTPEEIKGFIMPPVSRKDNTVCMMFEGFFVQVYPNGLNSKYRKEYGVLLPKKNMLLAPYLNIFKIPELVSVMVSSYGKHIAGNSSVKS